MNDRPPQSASQMVNWVVVRSRLNITSQSRGLDYVLKESAEIAFDEDIRSNDTKNLFMLSRHCHL